MSDGSSADERDKRMWEAVRELDGKLVASKKKAEDVAAKVTNKHVICLVGRIGAGKSTLACHLLGDELLVDEDQSNKCRIVAKNGCESFKIGQLRSSETRGASVEVVPGGNGDTMILDLAGHDGTDNMDVPDAVLRARVLNAAASVRLVLVMPALRFDSQSGRKDVVSDIKTIASLLTDNSGRLDMELLKSMGLIVHAKPTDIKNPLVQAMDQIAKEFKKLNASVQVGVDVNQATKQIMEKMSEWSAKACTYGHVIVSSNPGDPVETQRRRWLESLTLMKVPIWIPDVLDRKAGAEVIQLLLTLMPSRKEENQDGKMWNRINWTLPKTTKNDTSRHLDDAIEAIKRLPGTELINAATGVASLLHICTELARTGIMCEVDEKIKVVILALQDMFDRLVQELRQNVSTGKLQDAKATVQMLSSMDSIREEVKRSGVDELPAPNMWWPDASAGVQIVLRWCNEKLDKKRCTGNWDEEGAGEVAKLLLGVPALGENGEQLKQDFLSAVEEESKQHHKMAMHAIQELDVEALMQVLQWFEAQEHIKAQLESAHDQELPTALTTLKCVKAEVLHRLRATSAECVRKSSDGVDPAAKSTLQQLQGIYSSLELQRLLGPELTNGNVEEQLLEAMPSEVEFRNQLAELERFSKETTSRVPMYVDCLGRIADFLRPAELICELGLELPGAWKDLCGEVEQNLTSAAKEAEGIFTHAVERAKGSENEDADIAGWHTHSAAAHGAIQMLSTIGQFRFPKPVLSSDLSMFLKKCLLYLTHDLLETLNTARHVRSRSSCSCTDDGWMKEMMHCFELQALVHLKPMEFRIGEKPNQRVTEALEGLVKHCEEADQFLAKVRAEEVEKLQDLGMDEDGWWETLQKQCRACLNPRVRSFLSPQLLQPIEEKHTTSVVDWYSGVLNADLHGNSLNAHRVVHAMMFEASELFQTLRSRKKLNCPETVQDKVEELVERWSCADPNANKDSTRNMRRLSIALKRLGDGKFKELQEGLKEVLEVRARAKSDTENLFHQRLQEKDFNSAAKCLKRFPDEQAVEQAKGVLLEEFRMELAEITRLLTQGIENEDARAKVRQRILAHQNACADESCEPLAEFVAADPKTAKAFQSLKDVVAAEHRKAKEMVALALDNYSKEAVEVGLRRLSLSPSPAEGAQREVLEEYARKKTEMLSAANPPLSAVVALLRSCDVACKAMPCEALSLAELLAKADRVLQGQLESARKQIRAHQDDGDFAAAAALAAEASSTLRSLQEMELPKARGFQSLEWARTNLGEEQSNEEELEDLRRRLHQDGRSIDAYEHMFAEAMRYAARNSQQAVHIVKERLIRSIDCMESQGHMDQDFFTHLAIVEAFLAAVGDQAALATGLGWLRQRAKKSVEDCQKKVETDWECRVKGMEEAARDSDVVALARHLEWKNALGDRTPQQVSLKGRFDESLRCFWTRLEELLQRVCGNMERVNPKDLQLTVLEQAIRSSKSLSRHQHKQLMDTAPKSTGSPRPGELREWMHEPITEPLAKLWDASKIKELLDKESFDEIAQRLKVAEMIHKHMDSEEPKVDFIMTRVGELERQALDILQRQEETLDGFDTAFRILEGLVRTFREGPLADQATQACNNIERVVDKLFARVGREACCASLDAVEPILRLRTFAINAPVLHERVKQRLETVWKSHKKEGSKHVTKLGMALRGEQIGMLLVSEYPQFFGHLLKRNYVERLRTSGNLQPDVVVGGLSRHGQTAISQEERDDLLKMLQNHEEEMTSLLFTKYLGRRDRNFHDIVEIMRNDLRGKLAEFNQYKNKDAFRGLLTQLAACYSVLYSGESYLEADVQDQENVLVRPHAVQMLCLFELLDMHTSSQGSIIQWIVGGGGVQVSNVQNRLVELRTGEGKSITLGILSTILAKAGVPCDIVCYSEYLSQRDEEALKKLHEFAGVDKMIRYRTFDQLFRERLESIQKATRQLIESSETPTRPNQQSGKRVLLMDEVDVFFSRRFYGDTWDGAIILDSEEAKALVRYIFEQHNSGNLIGDISMTDAFKKVAKRYPEELRDALLQQACDMVSKVSEAGKTKFETKDGRVGYKTKDDVDFDVRHQNLTVFHYLQAEKEGIDATPYLGIDLCCGSFSFANLPLNNYSTILGVTGTLKDLMDEPGSAEILSEEYKIIHNSYIPSVWGQARLDEKEVVLCKSQAEWITSIDREAHQFERLGHPVLIFFKNIDMLHMFPQSGDYHQLTERTPKRLREGVVSAATLPQGKKGRITLMTRAFDRGVDFRIIAPEAAGYQETTQASTEAVVIQTFLPSTASEETQVKGRTARMGRPGTYLRVFCEEHLNKKFKISQEELGHARQDGKLNELLKDKQQEKLKTKCQGRSDRKRKADAMERQTQDWETLLFDPVKPPEEKRRRLLEFNVGGAITHYTLLLDKSHSMTVRYEGTASRWDHLTTAVTQFREALCSGKTRAMSRVSVVFFSDKATFPEEHHMMPGDMPNIPATMEWGGTDFSTAWKVCREVINQSAQGTRERIIFLTDGTDMASNKNARTQAIQDLLNHHGTTLAGVTCIAFGSQSGKETLEEICQMFRQRNIEAAVQAPQSAKDLVDTFVQAANRALHV